MVKIYIGVSGTIFYPEDGGCRFLWNTGIYLQIYNHLKTEAAAASKTLVTTYMASQLRIPVYMTKWKLIVNKVATDSITGLSNPKHITTVWITEWTERHGPSPFLTKNKGLKNFKNVSIIWYQPVCSIGLSSDSSLPSMKHILFWEANIIQLKKFSLNRMWKLYKNVIWEDNNFNDELEITWINVVKLCVNVPYDILNGRIE
jgi:hypothetical protein